jgi:hypothetical protein
MKPTAGHAGQPFPLLSLPALLLLNTLKFPLLPSPDRESSKQVSRLDCPIMVNIIAGNTSVAGATTETAQPVIAEGKEVFPQTLFT